MTVYTEEASSNYVDVKEGEINGKIHYNDLGAGEKVLVMLHGSGPGASGWSNFNRNIDPFVQEGYRVLLIDSPGFNKSYAMTTASRDGAYAQAVIGVLNMLGINKVNLVGNSMGGATAQRIAMDYPERVNKMIVMGGGSVGRSIFTPMPTEGLKLLQGLYRNPSMENLRKMLDVFVFDPSRLTEELITGRYENIIRRPEHLKNFVESTKLSGGIRPDFTARLRDLNIPTLLTWGRDDVFVPLDLGLRMLWALPDAELHIFSKCGHWAQWEHADKFNNLLLQFLARKD